MKKFLIDYWPSVFGIALSCIILFLVFEYDLKDDDTVRRGQKYLYDSIDEYGGLNPFEVDTVIILDVQRGWVKFQLNEKHLEVIGDSVVPVHTTDSQPITSFLENSIRIKK